MTFIAQAPEGCQMWLHEMFQFEVIKQTWEEKRFGRKVDGPWTLNGEGSMDLLVSQVSNRTLVRRVVKKESERSFSFSVHSDMSVSDVIFDLFEKKGRGRTYPNECERESLDRWIILLYNHICTIYIYIYMFHFCSYIYLFPYDMFLPLLKVSGPLVNFKTVVTQRVITI